MSLLYEHAELLKRWENEEGWCQNVYVTAELEKASNTSDWKPTWKIRLVASPLSLASPVLCFSISTQVHYWPLASGSPSATLPFTRGPLTFLTICQKRAKPLELCRACVNIHWPFQLHFPSLRLHLTYAHTSHTTTPRSVHTLLGQLGGSLCSLRPGSPSLLNSLLNFPAKLLPSSQWPSPMASPLKIFYSTWVSSSVLGHLNVLSRASKGTSIPSLAKLLTISTAGLSPVWGGSSLNPCSIPWRERYSALPTGGTQPVGSQTLSRSL